MQMGIIPAITHTASSDMVLYALVTLIADSLWILFSWVLFLFVWIAGSHAAQPYLSMEVDTLASRRLLLLLGPALFGMMRAIAACAFAAFPQA